MTLIRHPHFSPAAFTFLRSLKRNNRRDWFNLRRGIYETELKAPMLALLSAINHDLEDFAPEMATLPNKAMLRIYRDIRFSHNKQPYKTYLAAYFKVGGLFRTSGAGFYLRIAPEEIVVAAGAYMPERDQLLAMRNHIAQHHQRLRAILKNKNLRKYMGELEGDQLSRVPKGFPADHPAADLLQRQQWAVSTVLPGKLAISPKLVSEITKRFRLAWPLVSFLNEPLTQRRSQALKKNVAFGLAGF